MTRFSLITRIFAAGAVYLTVAGAAVTPSYSAELEEITFLANYAFHGRHSPFFVALEKGYYEEAGFDVNVQPATGSGFVISAVDSGQADFGMADASTMIQAIAKGAKVKAFQVFMDTTTSGLASLTPHEAPESVLDETISVSLTDSARVILPIILEQHGLDPERVNWEAADPSVYFSLLLSEQTDIIAATIDGDIPALRAAAAKQDKEIYFSHYGSWGYDVFGYFLIARADRLESDPDSARRFAAATQKAVEYSMENPEEAAQINVKYNPTLKQDVTLAQWTQSIIAMDTPYVEEHGYGVATPERVAGTLELLSKALKLELELAPEDVYVFDLGSQ